MIRKCYSLSFELSRNAAPEGARERGTAWICRGSRVPNTATASSTRPAPATPFPRHGGILRPAVFAVARRAALSNTNPPRDGAAGSASERNRIADQEKAQPGRRGKVGPSPGRPKKAPARIPGQLRDPREEKNPGHPARRDRNGNVEHPDRPGKSGAPVSASAGLTRPARRKRVAATITSLADPGAFPRPSVLRRSPGGRTGSREADPKWGTPPACGSVRCNRPCRQQPHRCMPDGHSADGSWCSS